MDIIKIYLVDDHQIMLDGIKALLKSESKFKIVGENTNAKMALTEIKNLNVDIVITDIQMPDMDGLAFTIALKQQLPAVKVLVLSMSVDGTTIQSMIQAGISGYVIKNTGRDELKQAIIKVASDQIFFSDVVNNQMMQQLMQTNTNKGDAINLTQREIEVIKLIAQELSNAEIGARLFISERTVETHRKNIFRKTQAKSVLGLVRFATQQHLL
ncbi:MAG: response regulator transcription factor [Bacteroidia bacterium]|nr:response regulator transcription factor [Bacteroidia bacterium]